MKPRVVITHRVHDSILASLEPHCELITNQSAVTLPPGSVRARAATADAMMAFMPDRVSEEFLVACPDLKVIGAALKGFDNFDVDACTRHGVWLTFVPDLLTVPTAELTVGLTIGLIRQIRPADQFVRSGEFQGWQPQFYGLGIEGSTMAGAHEYCTHNRKAYRLPKKTPWTFPGQSLMTCWPNPTSSYWPWRLMNIPCTRSTLTACAR